MILNAKRVFGAAVVFARFQLRLVRRVVAREHLALMVHFALVSETIPAANPPLRVGCAVIFIMVVSRLAHVVWAANKSKAIDTVFVCRNCKRVNLAVKKWLVPQVFDAVYLTRRLVRRARI